MRVLRTLAGIVLITMAVLCFVVGGAVWVAMQHEGSGGAFSGPATGLSTPGNAIVVPDVDAMLRARAPFTGRSSTTVRIEARTVSGAAFIGLAPIASVQTYLGPVGYARVTTFRIGAAGVPVDTQNVAAVRPPGSAPKPVVVPAGAPAAQGFWIARSVDGQFEWSPADHRLTGLALVVMRADAGGPVAVTAQVEVRPGWMNATSWALFSMGTVIALIAIALLMWPPRRREIVYVVEHAQLPEIAERLGVPLALPAVTAHEPGQAGGTGASAAGGQPDGSKDLPSGSSEESAHPGGAPTAVSVATGEDGFAAAVAGLSIGQMTGLRSKLGVPASRGDAGSVASAVGSSGSRTPHWAEPTGGHTHVPPMFADPKTRPDSLQAAMLLNPVSVSSAGSMPAPTRTNENGTYRSFGTAPPVTPAFVWTPPDSAATATSPSQQPIPEPATAE